VLQIPSVPSTTFGFLLIASHRRAAAQKSASTEESLRCWKYLGGLRWFGWAHGCLGLQRDAPGAGRVSPEDGNDLFSLTVAVIVGVVPVCCGCPWTVPNPS